MVEWHGMDGWTDGKEGIKKGHRTMTEQAGQHKRKVIEAKGSEALYFCSILSSVASNARTRGRREGE